MTIGYSISIKPEDMPVRGNVMASGDEELDRKVEDEIIARLDRGETWAWCIVKVTATLIFEEETFIGVDYLCGCTYRDEDDFRQPRGYFEHMKREARAHLLRALERAVKRGTVAKQALEAL